MVNIQVVDVRWIAFLGMKLFPSYIEDNPFHTHDSVTSIALLILNKFYLFEKKILFVDLQTNCFITFSPENVEI